MQRIHVRLIFSYVFLITLFFNNVDSLQAQVGFGGPGAARGMTFSARYDYFDPAVRHQAVAEVSQMRNMGLVNPRLPLIYTSSLNLAVGARFNPRQDSTSLIWRAGLVDAELQRKMLAFGFTVLDLDKTGTLEENFRWVNARIGPGFSLGSRKFSLGVRALGTIGIHSIVLGRDNYREIGPAADSTLSGIEVGYRVAVPLQIGSRILLLGEWNDRILVDTPEPRFKTLLGGLRVILGKADGAKFVLSANYRREEVTFTDSTLKIKNNFFQARLQYSPAPPRPRSPFDDEF